MGNDISNGLKAIVVLIVLVFILYIFQGFLEFVKIVGPLGIFLFACLVIFIIILLISWSMKKDQHINVTKQAKRDFYEQGAKREENIEGDKHEYN